MLQLPTLLNKVHIFYTLFKICQNFIWQHSTKVNVKGKDNKNEQHVLYADFPGFHDSYQHALICYIRKQNCHVMENFYSSIQGAVYDINKVTLKHQ